MNRLRVRISQNKVCNPYIYIDVINRIFPCRVYLPFKEAREMVCNLHLRGKSEWLMYRKNNNITNIPFDPDIYYRDEWNGWNDFLGTNKINNWDKKELCLPFEDAKEFVKSLGLKNKTEWRNYCKYGKKPSNIPSAPEYFYVDKWEGYNDWLSVDSKNKGGAITRKIKLTFIEAREYARSLYFKEVKEWRCWAKSSKRPFEIPGDPPNAYREEWEGWGDWLGCKNMRTFYSNMVIPSFEEMRAYARSLNLSTSEEWINLYEAGKLPHGFLKYPRYLYKDEWQGWGDFLGANNNFLKRKKIISFKEAKKFLQNIEPKIQNCKEWKLYAKSPIFPDFLPKSPSCSYKNEWTNWADFLGKKK